MRNKFEDSCTEEGTGVVKVIFEGDFKFAASEARKKFDNTASELQRREYWSTSSSTQDHQELDIKLKYRVI